MQSGLHKLLQNDLYTPAYTGSAQCLEPLARPAAFLYTPATALEQVRPRRPTAMVALLHGGYIVEPLRSKRLYWMAHGSFVELACSADAMAMST